MYTVVKLLYYIPTNVISLDTVDFTECDPMLRITTLWFSESKSPLSETDDVVHNVFLNTQCIRYCDVIHIAEFKICTKYFISFEMKPRILLLNINASSWCFKNDFQLKSLLRVYSTHRKITCINISFENKCWTVDQRNLFPSFW